MQSDIDAVTARCLDFQHGRTTREKSDEKKQYVPSRLNWYLFDEVSVDLLTELSVSSPVGLRHT